MDNGEKYLEDNIERLIQAGVGLPRKPDPQMKEQTLRRLMNQLDIKKRRSSFPDSALVVLACTLAWMAIWIMKHMLSVGWAVPVTLPLDLVHIVLALNLLCVPVAGITIVVTRRRSC